MKQLLFIHTILISFFGTLSSVYAQNQPESQNPLGTQEQISAEKLAIQIVDSPQVRSAKESAKDNWLAVAYSLGGASSQSVRYLQEAIDESAFSTALAVSNINPQQPKVISILAAPHHWFGMNIPGSRQLFDNPDTTYRTIPVNSSNRYVITGKVNSLAPVDVNFSVYAANSSTISNLTGDQIVASADGSFSITADFTASDGTPNHVQLTPQAASFFIRNTVSEWNVQQFETLAVQNTTTLQSAPAPSLSQLIQAVASAVTNSSASFQVFNELAYAQPVNTLPAPTFGGTAGRLATQAATYSAFKISDDQALVLTVNTGGAKYFIAPVYDRWFITTDYIHHTQSLNNSQAVPNPDGTYTFVIAVKDPHVYNWVDTVGLNEGLINLRWQNFASSTSASPSATLELVNLSDLPAVLPPNTKYVSAAERAAQIEAREASYSSRYSAYSQ